MPTSPPCLCPPGWEELGCQAEAPQMQNIARLMAGQGEVEDRGEKGFSWASPREMCNSSPPYPLPSVLS